MARFLTVLGALCAALLVPGVVLAGEGHPNIPGAQLSVLWAIPFVCMLLSIAIMPLALPHFWEKHFGKIAAFWGLAGETFPLGSEVEVTRPRSAQA